MPWKIPGDIFHGVENRTRLHRTNGGTMIYVRPSPRRHVFMGKGGMNNNRQAPRGPLITRRIEQVCPGYAAQGAASPDTDVR